MMTSTAFSRVQPWISVTTPLRQRLLIRPVPPPPEDRKSVGRGRHLSLSSLPNLPDQRLLQLQPSNLPRPAARRSLKQEMEEEEEEEVSRSISTRSSEAIPKIHKLNLQARLQLRSPSPLPSG